MFETRLGPSQDLAILWMILMMPCGLALMVGACKSLPADKDRQRSDLDISHSNILQRMFVDSMVERVTIASICFHLGLHVPKKVYPNQSPECVHQITKIKYTYIYIYMHVLEGTTSNGGTSSCHTPACMPRKGPRDLALPMHPDDVNYVNP